MAPPFPHSFDTPPLSSSHHDHEPYEDEDAEHTPSRPLSGPGTSQHTRRLQLRNNGFRAAVVPTRKATPKSALSSSNWSSVSGVHGSSDVENVSPSGTRPGSEIAEGKGSRRSSGILQEIGNSSTLVRPKKTRPRLSSAKLFASDAFGKEEEYFGLPTSPPPPGPKTTIRPRTVKNRGKVSHQRRSVSAETSKYIEHLESELAATQSQLSSITSPSVTREQSTKLRTLNAETRQLHEEIADWEAKYEERVQEEVDGHREIESGLRARIRNLEHDAGETRVRVQELEAQVESAGANLEAVEAANVNLERRLEIMSELLAASPSKLDFHAQTPVGRGGRRHIRPKSMLPRFPTASSLMSSPERQQHRQPQTQPASPVLNYTYSPSVDSAAPEFPRQHGLLSFDNSSPHYRQQSDYISDADSVLSEGEGAHPCRTADDDSLASAVGTYFSDILQQPNYNRWNLPPPPSQIAKAPKPPAARRMRRFGAGSAGPRPLILPSTSGYEILPSPASSAPPLERSETAPALFFPDTEQNLTRLPFGSRRRASTEADAVTRRNLADSSAPFLDVPPSPQLDVEMMTADNRDVRRTGTPPSAESRATTTRWYSSIGSVGGRNLMEELDAARSDETTAGSSTLEQRSDFDDGQPVDSWSTRPLKEHNDEANGMPHCRPDTIEEEGAFSPRSQQDIPGTSLIRTSSSASLPTHSRKRSTSLLSTSSSPSIFDRFRILFGGLWRSPVALARHLVQTAQLRMLYIPAPLRNAQWWLVGVLLGPMAARRRMISQSQSSFECCGDGGDAERGPLLIENPQREGDDQEDDDLAYGTPYTSPLASPARKTSSGSMTAGKGKKRKMQPRHYCMHHSRRKHSPWVWLKFSLTLAFAVGIAFKDGPASLLKTKACACRN